MKKRIEDFSPYVIAESGQCFRMRRTGDSEYRLIASGRILSIKQTGENEFDFSCDESEFEEFWKHYFDLDTDYGQYRSLCLPEDAFLKECIAFGGGIRILNQDPFEMLISFIISQRKSVPAIRTSVERLCCALGDKLTDGNGVLTHAFPSPERLAEADTGVLSDCGLGYRAGYVREASAGVVSGETDLAGMSVLNTEELTAKLTGIKGVGIKVASCEALFGYHRLDTAPVDVWINRVLQNEYGGAFPEEYLPAAGVLQQYMFHYARITRLHGKK